MKEESLKAYELMLDKKGELSGIRFMLDGSVQSYISWSLLGLWFVFFLVTVTLTVIRRRNRLEKKYSSEDVYAPVALGSITGVLLLFIYGVISFFVWSNDAEAIQSKWEVEHGYPYLESLDKHVHDITKLDIDVQQGGFDEFLGGSNKTENSLGVNEIYGSVSYYNEDGFLEELDEHFTIKQNKEIDNPKLSYVTLEDDFGTFREGNQLLTVEVPEGYRFD